MVYDSYRSFASLRMTAKRKRVILNEVKNLYVSPANDIIIERLRLLNNRRGAPWCARWLRNHAGAASGAPTMMTVRGRVI